MVPLLFPKNCQATPPPRSPKRHTQETRLRYLRPSLGVQSPSPTAFLWAGPLDSVSLLSHS